jgi:uncharacterized integral membrane protein
MTHASEPTSRRFGAAQITVAVVAVILLVFALVNLDDVPIDFVVDTVNAPLILVIVICAALGFVLGWFVGRRRDNR